MSTNEYFNKTFRVTNSAVKLFNTIKPFHTHVLEVVEKYVFEESILVNASDSAQMTVIYRPKPDCDGEGWGQYYDNTFCGYDAVKCCEPFSCSGGFGIVWDNHSIFAQYVASGINLGRNSITVDGNVTRDVTLPVVGYVTPRTVRVTAAPELLDLFVGDGVSAPTQVIFELSTGRPVSIRGINVTTNSIELNSKLAGQFTHRHELQRENGQTLVVSVLDRTTTSSGFVVLHIDPTTATITANDITSKVILEQRTLNRGTYSLWNRVEEVLDDGTIVYSPDPNAEVVTAGTIDITINGEFPSPVETDTGAIVLRTALTFPRTVDITDGVETAQYTIVTANYDPATDVTELTLAEPLELNTSNPQDVVLRGYDSGPGFDGYAECTALTDTLLAPILNESLVVTYQEAAVPPAFRLAQSITRFSAPHKSTRVTYSSIVIERLMSDSQVRFAAHPSVREITYRDFLRPILISAGDDQFQLCVSLHTLTPSIVGVTDGHTFEWEQIDDSAERVTLTDIGNNTVQYSSTQTHTFRFWADRGTAIEQYDDMTVNATPTSRARSAGQALTSTITLQVSGHRSTSPSSLYPSGMDELRAHPVDAGEYDNGEWNVYWTAPADARDIVEYQLQQYNSSTRAWDDIYVGPLHSFGPVLDAALVRLRTVRRVQGDLISQPRLDVTISATLHLIPEATNAKKAYAASSVGPAGLLAYGTSVNTYTLNLPRLLAVLGESDAMASGHMVAHVDAANQSVNLPRLLQVASEDTEVPEVTAPGHAAQMSVVTSYSTNIPGSIVIGG